MSTVVDPRLDQIDAYIEFSNSKGMKITNVIDTHIQADHRSGGAELARMTGARYCLHETAETVIPHHGLKDDEEILCGNVIVRVLHTPGHTPESISLLVLDKTRGMEPWFLLTGDLLFVGSVGRPDLPGDAEKNARKLYQTLQEKILLLPDYLEIYPAHFSGSACGKGLSGKPVSTLGFEKRFNRFLSMKEEEFVTAITSDIPAKPAEMLEIIRKNQGYN